MKRHRVLPLTPPTPLQSVSNLTIQEPLIEETTTTTSSSTFPLSVQRLSQSISTVTTILSATSSTLSTTVNETISNLSILASSISSSLTPASSNHTITTTHMNKRHKHNESQDSSMVSFQNQNQNQNQNQTHSLKETKEDKEEKDVSICVLNAHITKNHRHILVEWLVDLHAQFKFPLYVLVLGVEMIDRLLNLLFIPIEKYQPAASACLILAAEICEEEDFVVTEMNAATNTISQYLLFRCALLASWQDDRPNSILYWKYEACRAFQYKLLDKLSHIAMYDLTNLILCPITKQFMVLYSYQALIKWKYQSKTVPCYGAQWIGCYSLAMKQSFTLQKIVEFFNRKYQLPLVQTERLNVCIVIYLKSHAQLSDIRPLLITILLMQKKLHQLNLQSTLCKSKSNMTLKLKLPLHKTQTHAQAHVQTHTQKQTPSSQVTMIHHSKETETDFMMAITPSNQSKTNTFSITPTTTSTIVPIYAPPPTFSFPVHLYGKPNSGIVKV